MNKVYHYDEEGIKVFLMCALTEEQTQVELSVMFDA